MRTFVFFAALLLFFSSCDNMTVKTGPGSRKPIQGNGSVTIVSREVSAFNAVECEGVFNIILDQGSIEALKVETDENLQQLIISEVKDSVLSIRMKDSTSFGKITRMNVYVTVRDLKKLSTKGVGMLKCASKLHFHTFFLNVKGVGHTSLDLEAEHLYIDADMVGALQLDGKVNHAVIRHNGMGGIKAFGMETWSLQLTTNGVGSAEVYATGELMVNASGVGGVRYKGKPQRTEISSKGIGKVEAVE